MEKRPLGPISPRKDSNHTLEKDIQDLDIESTEPVKATEKKRSKKPLLFVLVALFLILIAGVGTYGVMWYLGRDTDEPLATADEQVDQIDLNVTELLYAYQQGDAGAIRQYVVADESKTDVTDYTSSFALQQNGTPENGLLPDVDYHLPTDSLLYVDNNQVIRENLTTDVAETLIGTVGDAVPGGVIALDPSPPSEQAVFNVTDPQWSTDGTSFSFLANHFEGQTLTLFTTVEDQYVDIGEAFYYVAENLYEGSLDFSPEREILAERGMNPAYIFEQDPFVFGAVEYDQTQSSPNSVFALICQRPDGSFVCNDGEDNELVKVSIGDGEQTQIGRGNYADLTVAGEQLYVINYDGNILTSPINESQLEQQDTNIAQLAEIGTAAIESVDLVSVNDRAFALVYGPGPEGRQVSVIDLQADARLGVFVLGDNSSFSLLNATIE